MKQVPMTLTRFLLAAMAAILFAGSAPVFAAGNGSKPEIQSLDELVELVRQGRIEQSKLNQQREQLFLRNQNQQKQLLDQAIAQRKQLEARSAQLEEAHNIQKQELEELSRRLETHMGSLKELFAHLQSASGETAAQMGLSLTSVDSPDRQKSLTQLADRLGPNRSLPRIEELEQLWYQQQREMVESGKVKHLSLPVINLEGERIQADVVRIGNFNLVSGNHYLQFIPETGKVVELPKQPPRYMLGNVEDFTQSDSSAGLLPIAVDPTRGTLLNMLLEMPDMRERIDQGGIIGYFTIVIGALGILLAFERIFVLVIVTRKVADQKRHEKPSNDNPLGRILLTYETNRHLEPESLELKLGEAILRERAPLEKYLTLIKIVSVVAPLLGLLGTVTGMINTFQVITLFGTSDPKLLAGGISEALVTTVIGLVVAIPTVFFHNLASTRSKAVLMVLEEESTGLIAQRAEQRAA
ncbi:MAG: MotA/TolQ/ExbB proton channel family protein [Pseudomonadota bacterium]